MVWATRLAGVLRRIASQTKKALHPFLISHCGYVSVAFNFRKPCSEDGCGPLPRSRSAFQLPPTKKKALNREPLGERGGIKGVPLSPRVPGTGVCGDHHQSFLLRRGTGGEVKNHPQAPIAFLPLPALSLDLPTRNRPALSRRRMAPSR